MVLMFSYNATSGIARTSAVQTVKHAGGRVAFVTAQMVGIEDFRRNDG